MKKIILILILAFSVFSVSVSAENVYEFELRDAEGEAEGILDEFIDSIPDEIKDELPKNDSVKEFSSYDFEFYAEEVVNAVKGAIKPAIKTVSVLLGTVILSSVFSVFAGTVAGDSMKGVFSFCSTLCVALSIYNALETVFSTVSVLLKALSETMVAILPVMEVMYIRGGNLTTAAVTSTGINLMIGFTESLFAKVIEPAVYSVFVMSLVSSVTKNGGIAFMVKTLRGILTAVILIIMTLMSFVLSMQTSAGASADTFAVKTIKFAIGNYVPIIGGTVAESFSLLSGSLGVIKQSCGIIAIAVLIIAFLPPFCTILLNRIAVGLSGAAAGALGCERESVLLEECKGICTMLMSICAGAVVMYIIALGVFCKTPMAIR